MRHPILPAMLLAAVMVACATPSAKLDTSRPIRIESSGLGNTYHQGDKTLPLTSLEERLAKHPVAGPELEGYQAKKWTGLLLGAVGGALIGWNVGDNLTKKGEKSWTLALVGAGTVVAALPFALMADGQMHSAVEAYNGSFTSAEPKALGGAVPFVAYLPEPGGRKQCVAGVTMSF